MESDTEPLSDQATRSFLTEQVLWSLLSLPVPQIERVISTLTGLIPDERAEHRVAEMARGFSNMTTQCRELITFAAAGEVAQRLQDALVSQPLPVFAAYMRACPQRKILSAAAPVWDDAIVALQTQTRALEAFVRAYGARRLRDASSSNE